MSSLTKTSLLPALLLAAAAGCSSDSSSSVGDLAVVDAHRPAADAGSGDGPAGDASAVDLSAVDAAPVDVAPVDGPAVGDLCPAGDPSLLLCLPLDDDPQGGKVTDHSGAGNHGTVVGAPTSVAGVAGQAFAFGGGAGEHVVVPASGTLAPDALKTLEAWVRLDAMPAGPVGVVDRGSATIAITLRVDGGKPRIACSGGVNAISETIDLGTWLHVACVAADDGQVQLFVDGLGGSSVLIVPSPAACDLRIGAACDSHAERGFPGAIDSVRIYNRALTREEICLAAGRSWAGSCS